MYVYCIDGDDLTLRARLRFLRTWLSSQWPGNARALRRVGDAYRVGNGVRTDEARARRWYRRAVAHGDAITCYDLGVLLVQGDGGPVEQAPGRALLERAAEAGVARAQSALGFFYRDGLHGYPVDPERQAYWEERAARSADGDSSPP